ncbi:unnamed protein product [Brugia pahangi]|uniref:Uncharacterized protein n=1 Tax=Brugia pahangi TaxID=6280 RepID=A0A0N4T0J5_BRUPA|nr:unnamed protein product [Brugia pahangi]
MRIRIRNIRKGQTTTHTVERERRMSERRRGSLVVGSLRCTHPIHVLDELYRTHHISFWHHSIPHIGISLRCTVLSDVAECHTK